MKRFLVLLLILCLCGCAAQNQVSAPSPVEEEIVTPEPPPEPQPVITTGTPLTVDGTDLSHCSVLLDGVPYVALEDLLDAFGAEYKDPCNFRWMYTTVQLTEDSSAVDFPEEDGTASMDAPVLRAEDCLYVSPSLCQILGMSFYEDEDHLYITSENGDLSIPEGYHVPTLMYHAVGDDLWGYWDLFVSPAEMEAQLQYLTENGFTTIHFSDLQYIDRIEKPVLLTFDDGYVDNYQNLFPLLQKYNCKATIFVITGSLGSNEHSMTWEQAKEMADSGLVSIQSHTVTHPDLDLLTAEAQTEELLQSKLAILRNVGREPYVISYPTGRYNADTLPIAETLYDFGLKMNGQDYFTGQNPMEINRWYVPRGLALGTFADMVA